ncbi:hypothetical protein PIB30_037618 [Stylosanthes scabra]|uniref:Uncharacterized protein n=1 Tax=Stylosanthes scabra TaxID=79078 RepID=A0ABU6YB46_9FABA|nr:hypothetical protein [Stylosanthes scabra]
MANSNSNANLNSGSNLKTESDSSGLAVVTNQTAAQIQNSNIENIRQYSGNNNNGNQTVNSGGNNRGPRPRITQPPFNSAVNVGWPPYGLPQNYSPPFLNSNFGNNSNPAFQFGSVPNSNQFFPEMSRSVEASSSNPGVLIQTVRQLIDESHLDLVNLLTQHLTSILNPIMTDTNSKYDYLANQVERVSRLVHDDNTENQNNAENRDENTLGGGNVRIVQRGQNAE